MQYYLIDKTYYQVVNGDLDPAWKINSNNLWTLDEATGLYDMQGGPSHISLDRYELREVVRQVPVMQVGKTRRA